MENKNIRNFANEAYLKQFEFAGYEILTLDDLKGEDIENEYRITPEQKKKFKEWFIYQAGKQLSIGKQIASKEFESFCRELGLVVEH